MYAFVNTGTEVAFEWDEEKAASNLAKHGVSFGLATAMARARLGRTGCRAGRRP